MAIKHNSRFWNPVLQKENLPNDLSVPYNQKDDRSFVH